MPSTFKVAAKWADRVGRAATLALGLALTSCANQNSAAVSQEKSQPKEVMRLIVPDAGWHWQVERILERDNAVWIFTELRHSPGMNAQMITTLELTLPVEIPTKPRRVFVAGKTWAWKNDEPYEFVANFDGLVEQAGAARQRYPLRK